MEIQYQKHSKRRKRAMDFWLKVAQEYNSGLTAEVIAKKYTNPLTRRNYTRAHIYWILERISKGI